MLAQRLDTACLCNCQDENNSFGCMFCCFGFFILLGVKNAGIRVVSARRAYNSLPTYLNNYVL